MAEKPLGRRVPTDFNHVNRYRLTELIDDPASVLVVPPQGVEKGLGLPRWNKEHVQVGGTCVDFGSRGMMSITNARQYYIQTGKAQTFRYEPYWLYHEAQAIDDWAETPPEEGTSVRAACDILRNKGHKRVRYGVVGLLDPGNGISANRWAVNHDEVRAAIFANLAVAIGVTWLSNFDTPILYKNEYWIGIDSTGNPLSWDKLGYQRGGHCTCLYKMSDRRQAFGMWNSWEDYPIVWMPYQLLDYLISDFGEVAVITDR